MKTYHLEDEIVCEWVSDLGSQRQEKCLVSAVHLLCTVEGRFE